MIRFVSFKEANVLRELKGLSLPLLDYLAYQSGCIFLSDMRVLSAAAKWRLARTLERIPPEAASLWEWQDALEYLTGGKPGPDAAQTRKRLIAALSAN